MSKNRILPEICEEAKCWKRV